MAYKNFDWGILRVDAQKVYPNAQALYGTYSSVTEAYNAIHEALGSNIPMGFKFGVVDQYGEFEEYVFATSNTEDGIEKVCDQSPQWLEF